MFGAIIPWLMRGGAFLFNLVKTALSPANLVKTAEKIGTVAGTVGAVANIAKDAIEGAKKLPGDAGKAVQDFSDKNKFIEDGLNSVGKVANSVQNTSEKVRPILMS